MTKESVKHNLDKNLNKSKSKNTRNKQKNSANSRNIARIQATGSSFGPTSSKVSTKIKHQKTITPKMDKSVIALAALNSRIIKECDHNLKP